MLEEDIITAIVLELQDRLTEELVDGYPASDPLRATAVFLAPLQDDPTINAPFVLIALDHEQGREPTTMAADGIEAEIGGITYWRINLTVSGWFTRQVDKLSNYRSGNAFANRVFRALLKHQDLGGLTAADGEQVTSLQRMPIRRMVVKQIGGEDERYSRYVFQVFFPTARTD